MARKPKHLDDDRIVALSVVGWKPERIARELGENTRTISRRVNSLAAKINAARVPKATKAQPAPPADPTQDGPLPQPEEVEAVDSVSDLDTWLAIAQRQAKAAEGRGDVENLSKYVRLATMIMDQKRKLAPPPKQDPNEQPDMVAAAKRAREMLHALIDSAAA